MPKYEIGSKVRWVHALSSVATHEAGTVIGVIPNDKDLDAFTMYDITFPFGKFTLYGTQIESE